MLGAVAPNTGYAFALMFETVDGEVVQYFIDKLSRKLPTNKVFVMLIDNAAYHRTDELSWPTNIIPFFLPPYSPELNPIERVWKVIKRKLSGVLFENINEIFSKVCAAWNSISKESFKSIARIEWSEIRNF